MKTVIQKVIPTLFLIPNVVLAAPTATRTVKKISACERAYQNAISSPSVAVVLKATEICEHATTKACQRQAFGPDGEFTGDGRWLAAACRLTEKWGANKALNNGVATQKCGQAFERGTASPSVGDLADAEVLCEESTDRSISDYLEKNSDGPGTGDARLIQAVLYLEAAHGGYQEVIKD